MTGLGLVGTGAAFLNYRKAKANYETLKERHEGLLAAIQTYAVHRLDEYANTIDTVSSDQMPGVKATTILRVGNLVGNFFRCKASVVLTNTSDSEYYIHSVAADCFVSDTPVMVFNIQWDGITPDGSKQEKQEIRVDKFIKPGETLEIGLPSGISALYNKEGENITGALRDMICSAAGKSLITSCPKLSIVDGCKADIMVRWSTKTGSALMNWRMIGKASVLRYCKEAFYPG